MAVGPRRRYPDFCIDQYWGADANKNPKADIVRVVIEVGSLNEGSIRESVTRSNVRIQLHQYMELVGPDRWHGRLLGIGMLGNRALLAKMWNDGTPSRTRSPSNDPSHAPQPVISGRRWISIFDPRFVAEIDSMYEYCMNHDGDWGKKKVVDRGRQRSIPVCQVNMYSSNCGVDVFCAIALCPRSEALRTYWMSAT